jgi:hypothetical protein
VVVHLLAARMQAQTRRGRFLGNRPCHRGTPTRRGRR